MDYRITRETTANDAEEIWKEWKEAGYTKDNVQFRSNKLWLNCDYFDFPRSHPIVGQEYRIVGKNVHREAPKSNLADDAINHPEHYTSHPSGVECKDIIGHYPFMVGAAIKYLWRGGKKGDIIEDYRKAIKCIEFEIERINQMGNE